MKYSTPIMTALAAMAPTAAQSWTTSLFFPETTSSIVEDFVSPASKMIQRQQALMDRAMMGGSLRGVSSPKYEIINDDEQFKLAVAVPGVAMEDLKVNLEDKILTVSGHQEKEKKSDTESYSFTSQFSQSFSLTDPAIDLDKFSATLENGVLLVTAPKDMKKIEENVRSITITSGDTGNHNHEVKIESKDDEDVTKSPPTIEDKKEEVIDPELELTKETYDIKHEELR